MNRRQLKKHAKRAGILEANGRSFLALFTVRQAARVFENWRWQPESRALATWKAVSNRWAGLWNVRHRILNEHSYAVKNRLVPGFPTDLHMRKADKLRHRYYRMVPIEKRCGLPGEVAGGRCCWIGTRRRNRTKDRNRIYRKRTPQPAPKPARAQEINDQLADLLAVEVARLVMWASNQKPESLEETAENMTVFLCSLSTGHEIQAHPITEEDRRLCRLRYTITEPPQPQRVTVNITTENP